MSDPPVKSIPNFGGDTVIKITHSTTVVIETYSQDVGR